MKKETVLRFLIYIAGLFTLAFGLTLNTTTGLGVSAIISVAHALSAILGLKIGDTTLLIYSFLVLLEIIIHIIIFKKRGDIELKRALLFDVLQLPLTLCFTRVMNLFSAILPMLTELDGIPSSFPFRFIVLLFAIAFTGIGAALSLDMRLVPNPGDGIVQTSSDLFGLEVGLMKNIIDLINIILSIALSLIFLQRISSVGIGTICSVIGVGRVISIFNRLFLKKLKALT